LTRAGIKKDRDGVTRKCVATGQVKPTAELIRFVVSPDGVVTPDLLGKLPGRGIWVSADRGALTKAAKKGGFARAAKAQVKVPDNLVEGIETALVGRVVEMLSLARKAGAAVAGYEKVKSWLETGRARVLIQAKDGSARGKQKLRPPTGEAGFIGDLSAQELGLAFGRENVIHCALATGGLATRVVEEAARLHGLRVANGGKPAGKGKKT
jgi:predicted RNA-binding protein YlxR (DUF448 family)